MLSTFAQPYFLSVTNNSYVTFPNTLVMSSAKYRCGKLQYRLHWIKCATNSPRCLALTFSEYFWCSHIRYQRRQLNSSVVLCTKSVTLTVEYCNGCVRV